MTNHDIQKTELPTLYSVLEAGTLLGTGRSKTWDLIWKGQLGHYRIGKKIQVSAAHISDFLKGREVAPHDAKAIAKKTATDIISASRKRGA
jgi:excisionase family DNA binding protein